MAISVFDCIEFIYLKSAFIITVHNFTCTLILKDVGTCNYTMIYNIEMQNNATAKFHLDFCLHFYKVKL